MKKRRVDNPANPIEVPLAPNVEWALDFMSDSLANGKKFRTLNIVDQYNRKCLEIGINFTLPSRKVIEILERTIDEYGKPLGIRTDNGPEFTSSLFQNWLDKNEIEWVKIQKGKPQQNAIIERFNRTYREVIVNAPKYLATTLNENKLENQSRIICLGIHSLNRELIYR
jgi:putative transposase